MGRTVRRFLTTLAVAGLVGLGSLAVAAPAPKAADEDMTLGPARAKVTVIEYASLTCPHCARWDMEVFPEFKRKYVDTGQVRYIFREFPTSPVEVAAAGFLIARCGEKAKYFDAIDTMFRAQAAMYDSGDAGPALRKEARAAGLTDDQARACTNDEAGLKALNARVEKAAKEQHIEATPTFLVNGMKFEGEQKIEALDAAIAPLLAK